MIDWDKPIETLDGYPAWVIAMNYRRCGDKLRVVQIEYSEFDATGYYHQDGEPALGSPKIRNLKTKREGWVNVYAALIQDRKRIITQIYESEQEAKAIASSDVIATVKIKWEE